MARWWVWIALGLVLLGWAGIGPATASDDPPTLSATLRAMVSAQINAFRRDDAEAAYRLASPTIQGLYPGPARFMAMVRLGYAPLYRARSVTFGKTVETPQGPELDVYVIGPDGRSWLAVYQFEQQPDGTWRIHGCVLSEDGSRGA